MLPECRPPNGGVADMNAVELFVRAAMDRESDGWDVAEAFDNALWAFLANKDDEDPDVFLAYFAARQAIRDNIVKGVKNEPDYGGDYTFPGRVN